MGAAAKALAAVGTAVMVVAAAFELLDRWQNRSAAPSSSPAPQIVVTTDAPSDAQSEQPIADRRSPTNQESTLESVPAGPREQEAARSNAEGLVNRRLVPASSTPTMALALEGDDAEPIEARIAADLSSPGLRLVPGYFKPAFTTGGFLRAAYEGDTEILSQSGALAGVDYVLLGRVDRSCGKTSQLDADLVTCTLHLHYKTFDRTGALSSSGSVSVNGPGFSEDAARDRAIEMLIEQHGQRLIAFD